MNIGMLWLDDDKKTTLAAKLAGGAAYYLRKYSQAATQVHVHPDTLACPSTVGGPALAVVPGLVITPNRTVLRDHFWFGLPEGPAPDA